MDVFKLSFSFCAMRMGLSLHFSALTFTLFFFHFLIHVLTTKAKLLWFNLDLQSTVKISLSSAFYRLTFKLQHSLVKLFFDLSEHERSSLMQVVSMSSALAVPCIYVPQIAPQQWLMDPQAQLLAPSAGMA